MMNSSMTLLQLTRVVLLVATLLTCTCFPANSTNSLEQDMCEAKTRASSGTTTPAQDEVQTATPTQRSPLPREHFKQMLRSYYYTNPLSRGMEELTSFFSLSELYRLGPLSINPDVDLYPPTVVIERTKALCQRMVGNLNTTPNVNDYCHWKYRCNFNANRFPSMIVNATECTAQQGSKCVKRVTEMQTFTRTFSNDKMATWRKDDEPVSITYAYTCRRVH